MKKKYGLLVSLVLIGLIVALLLLISRKTTRPSLVIINDNPHFIAKISSNDKLATLLEATSYSSTSGLPITLILSPQQQAVNNSWPSGVYSGFSYSQLDDSTLVTVYLNAELFKKNNWTEQRISREAESLFVQALLSLSQKKDPGFQQQLDAQLQEQERLATQARDIIKQQGDTHSSAVFKVTYAQ